MEITAVYLPALPLWIVWLIGAIVAMMRWKQHPKISALVLAAMILTWLSSVIFTGLNLRLPIMLYERGMELQESRTYLTASSLLQALMGTVPYILLLSAAFMRRRTEED